MGNTVIHNIWQEPEPLNIATKAEQYPSDALPGIIREAIDEVHEFVQAPYPLVASSAIAAISMATQHVYDVERDRKLTGPCSIFALAVAPSGDRKTTLDKYFTSAITDWQVAQAERLQVDLARWKAAATTWELKRQALVDRIKAAAKKEQATSRLEDELHALELDQPERPRVPHILRGDDTPEALAHALRFGWPSAGIVSSEAGIVLGSHSMSAESVMRNLALLNVLWDGGSHSVGRRSKESFTVRGARLTVALQVQPETLRHFIAQHGALARGTGFLARFLICAPESTQGTRLYREPPEAWPALERFNRRIRDLLDHLPVLDSDGAITTAALPLSAEAKRAWVDYHDAIESRLGHGGELCDVRDVAAKSADNAARLACLFHVFAGSTGPITRDAIVAGSRVAAWHLSESHRLFESVVTPQHVQDAIDLERWLIKRCRESGSHRIPRGDVQRCITPVRLRKGALLTAALAELERAHRVRLIDDGPRRTVHVSPKVISPKAEGG